MPARQKVPPSHRRGTTQPVPFQRQAEWAKTALTPDPSQGLHLVARQGDLGAGTVARAIGHAEEGFTAGRAVRMIVFFRRVG